MNINLGGWEKYIEPNFINIAETNIKHASYLVSSGVNIYPPINNIFSALEKTPPERCKIVITGQDPYIHEGQANGLAFSVNPGCKFPPSLRNIFKELHEDIGCDIPESGDLSKWAEQGVLLLNTILTVEEGRAYSHVDWDWQLFTHSILCATRFLPQPICYILWGGPAQRAAAFADISKSKYPRLIIKSPHPSPLSAYRGFFGSKPFSKANNFLIEQGNAPIEW